MSDAPPPPPPAVELRLRADHARVSPEGVALDGRVVVATRRWQLRADRLTVAPDGPSTYALTGPLSLQPCPCASPPLWLGLGSARLSVRGGDLDVVSLRRVTVRLAGLPVLYLPWWQLRSERHWGLLPPRLAWRAADGPLLGAGLHAPLGDRAWLALEPAAYLRGGHEMLARLRLPGGDLGLRWDRRPAGDLWALRGQGTASPRDPGQGPPPAAREGALAWSVDAQRGPLDRVIGLDDAARPRDRARVAWSAPWAGTLATSVRAVAPRGQGDVVAGPQTTWAGSTPDASLAWLLDASQLAHEGQGLTSVLRAEVDAGRSWWRGPWRVGAAVRALGAASGRSDEAGVEGAALASARIELPLVRDGEDSRHRLEPGGWLGAVASGRTQGLDRLALPPGLPPAALLGAARVRSSWQWPSGAQVAVRRAAGLVLSGDGLGPAARLVLAGDVGSLHAVSDLSAGSLHDGALAVIVAAGRPGGWRLDARLDGQLGHPGPHARLLDGASPWAGPWYDAPGWSAAAGAELPLGASWRASGRLAVSLDGDGLGVLDHALDWLGHGVGLRYANPCGCLSAGLDASRRLGRDGVDVMASLSLGAPAPVARAGGW